MGEFKKSGGFNRGGGGHSDRPRFGGDRGGFSRPSGDMGGNNGARAQMFSAVCSDCNRKCEVPFRPTGDRPVFCNDCFGNKRAPAHDGNQRREAPPARSFSQRDFTPPMPSSKLPAEDKRIDELKRQLDAVNKKLDTMMEMMKVTPKMDAVKIVSNPKIEVMKAGPAVETVKVSPVKKLKVKKSLKAKK